MDVTCQQHLNTVFTMNIQNMMQITAGFAQTLLYPYSHSMPCFPADQESSPGFLCSTEFHDLLLLLWFWTNFFNNFWVLFLDQIWPLKWFRAHVLLFFKDHNVKRKWFGNSCKFYLCFGFSETEASSCSRESETFPLQYAFRRIMLDAYVGLQQFTLSASFTTEILPVLQSN